MTPRRPTSSHRCGSALFADALAATRGSIVMVNSCVLHSSQPEYSGYKLSKGMLSQRAAGRGRPRLGPRGIRVNSVAPSYIYEDVNKAYFDWLAAESGRTHEQVYAEKAAATDLKRLALPEEVARAALFLASDVASAVTGTMSQRGLRRVPRPLTSGGRRLMTRDQGRRRVVRRHRGRRGAHDRAGRLRGRPRTRRDCGSSSTTSPPAAGLTAEPATTSSGPRSRARWSDGS